MAHLEGINIHHHQKKKKLSKPQKKFKAFIDKWIYLIVIIGPIMTIPQLTKIWFEKSAAGVSLISWTTYLILAIFWLSYGVVHKEKPLIISSALWVLVEFLIVLGVILYA